MVWKPKNPRRLRQLLREKTPEYNLKLLEAKHRIRYQTESLKEFTNRMSIQIFVIIIALIVFFSIFFILKPVIAQRLAMSATITKMNGLRASIDFITVWFIILLLYKMIMDRNNVAFPQGGITR